MHDAFDIGTDTKAMQCAAILAALQIGPLSTIAARELLGIAHPAGRVHEIKKLGYSVTTLTRTVQDHQGRPHKSAVYVLNGVQP